MSKAFILIPGARLPAEEADAVLARLTPAESAALASFGDGAGRRHTQVLDAGPCRRAPHLSWLWRVLTRRNSHPHEAPWRWLALGGREQAPELWCLTPLTLGGDGRILPETPEADDREFIALTASIEPVFLEAGFRLQIWDNRWFLTRREDWPLIAAPRAAVSYLTPAEAPLEGEAADDARALLERCAGILAEHPVNAERTASGRPRFDALWISGGGHEELFFPPTLFRSVAADDDAVRGWANAAGILLERLGRDTGRWPDAPQGDVIAVINDLYDPWLARDWPRWQAALEGTARRAALYREDAKRFGASDVLFVLFGETGAATLAPAEPASLMEKIFGRKKKTGMAPSLWCPDIYDATEAQ